jgi:hypothetical protein
MSTHGLVINPLKTGRLQKKLSIEIQDGGFPEKLTGYNHVTVKMGQVGSGRLNDWWVVFQV